MSNPFQALWDYQVAKFQLQMDFWAVFGPWGLALVVSVALAYLLTRMLTDRRR